MLGVAWSELSIRHGGSAVPGSTPLSAAAALARSDSVLLLPEMASAAECNAIVTACSEALELGQRIRVTMREHTQQQLVRQREQRALLFVERSVRGLDKDLQLVP